MNRSRADAGLERREASWWRSGLSWTVYTRVPPPAAPVLWRHLHSLQPNLPAPPPPPPPSTRRFCRRSKPTPQATHPDYLGAPIPPLPPSGAKVPSGWRCNRLRIWRPPPPPPPLSLGHQMVWQTCRRRPVCTAWSPPLVFGPASFSWPRWLGCGWLWLRRPAGGAEAWGCGYRPWGVARQAASGSLGHNQGRNQGHNRGRNQGHIQGRNQGRIQGPIQGGNRGRIQGRSRGRRQGRLPLPPAAARRLPTCPPSLPRPSHRDQAAPPQPWPALLFWLLCPDRRTARPVGRLSLRRPWSGAA
jgi:hypothetical protein